MTSPIVIPEDAPFSPQQRVWLSDFLGKLLSGTGAPSGPAVPVTILFGSQTGNAEGLAKKLVKTLKKGNFEPEVHDIGAYDRSRLAQEKNLLVITSTYGDGEPPDNAASLHSALMAAEGNILEGVQFSVFALGDSNYPAFCQCGKDFDAKLEALGATRVAPRVDGDADFDAPFATWSESLLGSLALEPANA